MNSASNLSDLSLHTENKIDYHLKELRDDISSLQDKYGNDYDAIFGEVEQVVKKFETSVQDGERLDRSRYKYQNNDSTTLDKARNILQSFAPIKKFNELAYQFATSPLSKELGKKNDLWKSASVSEMNYFSSLVYLYETYYKQLSKRIFEKKTIISVKQMDKVFQNIEDVKETAKSMLKKIESTCRGWPETPSLIGSAFLTSKDQIIEVYTKYSSGITRALKALSKYTRANESFSEFINQNSNQEQSQQIPFAKLLLLPLNRITEYKDLLNDLLFLTPEDHPDFKDLTLSYQYIRILDKNISLIKSEAFKLHKFFNIITHIKGNVPNVLTKSDQRELIREGPINTVQEKNVKKSYQYLFNDCILVSQLNETDGMTFSQLIWLKGSVVRESSKNLDNFVYSIMKDNLQYHFAANTTFERNSWVEDIRLLILNLENKRVARFNSRMPKKPLSP